MSLRYSLTLGLCTAAAASGMLAAGQSFLNGAAAKLPPIAKEIGSYRGLVQHVLPAVVSIEAKPKVHVARARMPGPGSPFDGMPGLPDEFRKKLEEQWGHQSTPQTPMPSRAFGSGFVVDPKGIVLTNDHVVRGADRVQVTLQDGRKFMSHDIKRDPKTDLAILRLDVKEPLPYLELGDSDVMEIGDRVLAIGAPLGLTGSVTSGIISAKARDIHMNMYEDFLQTDAAINPGNSGGPLVNMMGQVIGINSAIKSETGGFQGIGLAISSNLVKNVMTQLLKDGAVHRGYLGVQVGALEPEVAARLGLAKGAGVLISKVEDGTPAARGGLRDGDIVTTVAGRPVTDGRALQKIVASLPLGKPVELTVLRDGNRKSLAVTVQEQPRNYGLLARSTDGPSAEESAPTSLDTIGIKVIELTPERAKELGYAEKTEGVLIVGVNPEGIAAGAGLRSDMVVVKVEQVQVRTTEELQTALKKGSLDKGVMLQIKTPREGSRFVILKNASAE